MIGHRPNRLPADEAGLASLRHSIRIILEAARQQAPVVAVTSLAEGADRIFAREALALGCPLLCPLPFAQAEFERDFLPPAALEPDSLAHFRALLAEAQGGPGLTLLELNGARADAPAAYAKAGLTVLDHSQLLVAVWDGAKAAGQGGTADTLHAALVRRLPLLWLDARAPQNWTLLEDEAALTGVSPRPDPGLAACVDRLAKALAP